MTFAKRTISVEFTLSGGQTFDNGGTSVTVEGLRMSCQITKAGSLLPLLSMRIFGMPLSLMNRLSTLGYKINLLEQNQITVSVGDVGATLAIVFVGAVTMAWVDTSSMPDVAFDVSANGVGVFAVANGVPTSIQSTTPIATVMQSLAAQMNLPLENSGVSGSIGPSYYTGSPYEQARQIADANDFLITPDDGKLCIWPKNGSRGTQVPIVSSKTGMIGSPIYTYASIQVRTLYNPLLSFGGRFQIEDSILPSANKVWNIVNLSHNLDCQVPNGQWFSAIEAIDLSALQPPPQAQ